MYIYDIYHKKYPDIKDNEIKIGYSIYNSIFGTTYVSDKSSPFYFGNVGEHTITINNYRDNDKTKELLYSKFSVYKEDGKDAVKTAKNSIDYARKNQFDTIIIDTAGRLQIDEDMMAELVKIKKITDPVEVLLVADAMTGQNAVDIAKSFDEQLGLTGVILTKFDSDARGGAALSLKTITGKPILFIGTGEKTEDLEPFHPERIASRILGMGDIVSLVEKAQETVDAEEAMKLQKKMSRNEFTLQDMLEQFSK